MTFAKYPPENISEAITVFKQDVELAHGVVHGDEVTEVLTENGPVPSFQKVIKYLGDEVASATGIDVTLRSDLATVGSDVVISGVEANNLVRRYTEIVSVTEYGALGGANNDTDAFTSALVAGNGYAFVPYKAEGYTVNGNLEGLWGFGNIRFNGDGLIRYTDVAEYDGYKNAAFYADVLARNGNIQISCFGDSTMYGYKVGMPLPTDQDVNNPPSVLATTLRAVFSGVITVLNEAISGSNMRNMMRDLRFEGKIAQSGSSSASSIIYCNHCINNVQSEYSVDEFKKDYVDFVRICRKYGKVPVIVTPNPIVPIFGGDAIETRVQESYVNAMRDVAKITGCDIVDNYYYARQTANRFPLTVLVPDGIHPSSNLYLQNGRNLAIPLISAKILKSENDVAPLYDCSLKDTASSGTSAQSGTLSGLNYVSERNNSTVTGLYFATILDQPFQYLNLHGLNWEAGAKVKFRSYNFNTTAYWKTIGMNRQFGSASLLKWDSPYHVKTGEDCYAGLHVMEASFDITFTDPDRKSMAINAISVPPQSSKMISKISKPSNISELNNAVLTNQILTLNYPFTLGGTSLILEDYSGYDTLVITLTGGGALTATFNGTFGSSTETIAASGIVAGTKSVTITILDQSVIVDVDGATITKTITGWMPPLRILNSGYTGLVTNI